MTEENQVTMKGVEENRVTTKNPKKVKAGRRLAEYNRKKKEELKAQKSEVEPMLDSSQHYGIGAVLAVGVIGGLGYYLYQAKKAMLYLSNHSLSNHTHRLISLKCYKMDKKSIANDTYQAEVLSVFAVGYSMLGKKILKMTSPSIQKFDLEGTGKLVAITAASEMASEYLIKQKILPEQVNI